MLRNSGLAFLSLALSALWLSAAHPAEQEAAPGVNPRDNISKVELLYKYDHFDLGGSIDSWTFKYDKALDKQWGFNVELPFIMYEGFGIEDAGVGDIQGRVRYVNTVGQMSFLAGAELVVPSATGDTLGRGKWQANPVAGVVLALSQTTFVFAGYKHFFSFAGEGDRPDIDESQPRLLAGYTDPAGWWAIADGKYTKSWQSDRTETLDLEVELGQMVAPTTGVWIRAGTAFLDSDRDFGINLGMRNIF